MVLSINIYIYIYYTLPTPSDVNLSSLDNQGALGCTRVH